MTTPQTFQQLHQDMVSRRFLATNPVLASAARLTPAQVAEVLRQYVRFPEEIVSLLKGAALRFSNGSPITDELERNWGQENGSGTGGVPHVEIFKHALRRDLGIDAMYIVGSSSTERFITTVKDGMTNASPWFALGQAYALEASAVPELAMLVGPLINVYADKTSRPRPIRTDALQENGAAVLSEVRTSEEAYAMDMSQWFALHIMDFEVGHRDNLRACAGSALDNGGNVQEFARGFRGVMEAMDEWWSGLAIGT